MSQHNSNTVYIMFSVSSVAIVCTSFLCFYVKEKLWKYGVAACIWCLMVRWLLSFFRPLRLPLAGNEWACVDVFQPCRIYIYICYYAGFWWSQNEIKYSKHHAVNMQSTSCRQHAVKRQSTFYCSTLWRLLLLACRVKFRDAKAVEWRVGST